MKGDIISVQCTNINKDLMLLFKEEQKILLINLSWYILAILAISRNSGKDLPVKLWNRSEIWKNPKSYSNCRFKYYWDKITKGSVSAVRTGNITQHLQAERQMLKIIFAFDHINYSRYNSFQHVFLSNISKRPRRLLKISVNMELELHLLVTLLA